MYVYIGQEIFEIKNTNRRQRVLLARVNFKNFLANKLPGVITKIVCFNI